MKMLAKILIVVVIIIAIVLIAALFVKKDYTIEQEITINKPKQEVFDYVKYLKNQDNYSKWVMLDPAMKKDFRGTDGTVGFVYAWDSQNKNAGKGEQEISSLKEGQEVNMEVRFERPFKNTANTFITTQAVSPTETKVRWGMRGKNSYPMNLMNVFIPGILGKDLATSLATLKGILEKQ